MNQSEAQLDSSSKQPASQRLMTVICNKPANFSISFACLSLIG